MSFTYTVLVNYLILHKTTVYSLVYSTAPDKIPWDLKRCGKNLNVYLRYLQINVFIFLLLVLYILALINFHKKKTSTSVKIHIFFNNVYRATLNVLKFIASHEILPEIKITSILVNESNKLYP